MRSILRPALAYFGCVFAAGFALGTLRVLIFAPRLGERTAELLEMPLMLAVIFLAARLVVKRYRLASLAVAFATGTLALGLLVLLEFTLVLAVRGLTLETYLASRDPLAFAAYLVGLLVFALMPAIIRSLSGPDAGKP